MYSSYCMFNCLVEVLIGWACILCFIACWKLIIFCIWHVDKAIPCRIAFERGKERHLSFLAFSKGTSGWVLLSEEFPLKQQRGIVRVTAPLAGSDVCFSLSFSICLLGQQAFDLTDMAVNCYFMNLFWGCPNRFICFINLLAFNSEIPCPVEVSLGGKPNLLSRLVVYDSTLSCQNHFLLHSFHRFPSDDSSINPWK